MYLIPLQIKILNLLRRFSIILIALFNVTICYSQKEGASAPEVLRLSRALQFETLSESPQNASRFPVYREFIKWIEQSFPLVHQKLKRTIINEFSLLFEWQGSDQSLVPGLFLAHYDIVPADKITDKWVHPPFSGFIDNQSIWGRGAIDNKSQLFAILESIERLLQNNYIPQRRLFFAFGHDEESGGTEGAKKINEHFIEKGLQFEFILDEGGAMIEGLFPGMKKNIAFIGIAEKGYMDLELSVHADGGHSSLPTGENTIDVLADAITRLNARPMHARLQSPTIDMLRIISPHMNFASRVAFRLRFLFRKKILEKLSTRESTNTLIRTVLSPTIITGGVKENVLPDFARVNINVRLLQGDLPETVIAHIKKVTRNKRIVIGIKGPYHLASAITPVESELWYKFKSVILSLYPDVITAPMLFPATTDSRHYSTLSKNILRFMPVTLNAENKTSIHGINERIGIADYFQAIRFYGELIKTLDKN